MRRNVDVEAAVVAKYVVLEPVLDERARRLWAAAESRAIGFGGDALVSAATGLARQTIRRGREELAAGPVATKRIRRPGAGRPVLEAKQPGLAAALERRRPVHATYWSSRILGGVSGRLVCAVRWCAPGARAWRRLAARTDAALLARRWLTGHGPGQPAG